MGLHVPNDLALVGFDDIAVDTFSEPPLSTVQIPQYDLGYMAGEIVLKFLQAPSEKPVSYLYPVELIIRGSSRALPFSADERAANLKNLLSSFIPGPHISHEDLIKTTRLS